MMTTVKIYGASDDLVEIDGTLEEEFSCPRGRAFLSFSDGTILFIEYNNIGEWKISRMVSGSAEYSHTTPEGDDYTDKVELTGELRWALYTEFPESEQRIFVKAKREAAK